MSTCCNKLLHLEIRWYINGTVRVHQFMLQSVVGLGNQMVYQRDSPSTSVHAAMSCWTWKSEGISTGQSEYISTCCNQLLDLEIRWNINGTVRENQYMLQSVVGLGNKMVYQRDGPRT